jgi:hypothetical protein
MFLIKIDLRKAICCCKILKMRRRFCTERFRLARRNRDRNESRTPALARQDILPHKRQVKTPSTRHPFNQNRNRQSTKKANAGA